MRLRLLLLTVLLLAPAAWSQSGTTTVTAVIKDTNNSLYVNCTWSVVFVGENTTPGAGPYAPAAYTNGQQGKCDSLGNLGPIQLADNINTITPTPSQWQFNICSAPGYVPGNIICIPQTLVTITGSTQDLTGVFQPIAPLLPTGGGGGPAIALKINNSPASSQTTQNLIQGTNVTITDGGAGNITITSTGGGGGGSPGGTNTQVQINSASAFGGANCFTYDSTTQETDSSNFSKVRYVTSCWNWQQSPAADLSSPGSGKTITLTCSRSSPCVGIDTSATATKPYSIYISTVGTAEAALVTGGSCGLFATSNCTVVVTTVNAHSAGYTVGSAYAGIQEAMNDATSPNAKIILQPVGNNANAYQIFAPIFFQNQRSVFEADGSFVKCYTRSMCLVIGDLINSNDFFDERVHGLRIASGTLVSGVGVSNTSRTGCPGAGTCQINITTSAPHPFIVGDYVDIQMTNDTTYWGIWKITSSADNTHFVALYASQVNTPAPITNIGSASSIGQVALANAGIFDNGGATVMSEVQFESGAAGPAPTGKFHNGIVVFNDQSAMIDNVDFSSGSGFRCDTSYCANAIYGPGPFSPNAAVISVRGRNMSLGCSANGITNYGGNTLNVNDIVIQAFPQWSINNTNIRGGFGKGTYAGVYNEVGSCGNPQYGAVLPANQGEAGIIGGATIRGGEFPIGSMPSFACVGSGGTNVLYYWIIVKDSSLGSSAPLQAGLTAASCSGNVTVQWPRVQGTNTITYDILRSGTLVAGGIVAPYIGGCGGGTTLACGSVATAQAQCSSQICSFTDNSAASTTSYTVIAPTYFPSLYFWPGGAVMAAGSDSISVSSVAKMYMDNNPFITSVSTLISETAWVVPSYFAAECTSQTAGVWISCLAENSVTSNSLGATILQGGVATGGSPSGLKGRLNFSWPLVVNGDWITLVDTNPSATIADARHRPNASASDTVIGSDNTTGVASTSTAMAFGAPVSISNYINTLRDGTSWLERLTATKKEFKTPVQADSDITILGNPVGFSPFGKSGSQASDTCVRADGALGANWTVTDGTWAIASNTCTSTAIGGDGLALAAYTATSFSNDQYAQATMVTANSFNSGVCVRMSNSVSTAYCMEATSVASVLLKVVAGAGVGLATGGGYAAGDIIGISAQGTTITGYKNGVVFLQATSATIASGFPGMNAGNGSGTKLSGWKGGDLTWATTNPITFNNITITGTCTGCNPGTVTASGTLTSTAVLTGAGTTVVQAPSATTTLDTSGNFSTPGSYASTASNGGISGSEGNGTGNCTPGAGVDCLWMDSTDHRWAMNNNNAGKTDVASTFPSGTVTTAGTAVTNGTCQAQTGITITGAATTDNVVANIGATLPATWQTGIQLSAHVTSANTVTVYLCNPSAGSITPAATAVIVRVLR